MRAHGVSEHLKAAENALADAAVRDGHHPSMDAVGHIMAALAILSKCRTEKRVNRDDVEYDVLIVPKDPRLAT